MSAAAVAVTREISALHRRAAYDGYTEAIVASIEALWRKFSEATHVD